MEERLRVGQLIHGLAFTNRLGEVGVAYINRDETHCSQSISLTCQIYPQRGHMPSSVWTGQTDRC